MVANYNSMINDAYEIVKETNPYETILFKDLWAKVCERQGFTEEEARSKMSSFYTTLTLDGRFCAILTKNEEGKSVYKWTLSERVEVDVRTKNAEMSDDDVTAIAEENDDENQNIVINEDNDGESEEENTSDEENSDEL